MSFGWREYARPPTSDVKPPLNSKFSENNTHSILGMRLQVPKRYSRLFLGLVAALGIIFFFDTSLLPHRRTSYDLHSYPQVHRTAPDGTGLPPLFEAYTEYEDNLPQQQDDFAERKYIFMANHAYGCGWGNVLQEMIYSSLVATGSGRGFVWHDYTWNRDGPKYSDYNGKKIPSRVPISTMLSGYILGLSSTDETRPISRTIYERICPPSERVYIDKTSVEAHRQRNPANAGTSLDSISGKAVLEAWLDRLNQPDMTDARCVEVTQDTPQIFDIWVMGSKRLHDLWDMVVNSPILTGWSWSPLIYRAFDRNRKVISPVASFFGFGVSEETDSLPLLTLHLRRGDYADHCAHLAHWDSTYTGQSSFPVFEERDAFVSPKVVEGHSNSNLDVTKPGEPPIVSSEEVKVKYYAKHCYPDVRQVVERVREIVHDYEAFTRDRSNDDSLERGSSQKWGRKTWQKRWGRGRESVGNKLLRRIYIMTNGDRELLQEMKQALIADAERSKGSGAETSDWEFEWTWDGVSTSRDLELGWEEKPVGQALDMYIAQRSEVFVGNGFSSLTANIVMLRMKDGRDPLQIRFW